MNYGDFLIISKTAWEIRISLCFVTLYGLKYKYL